MSTIRFILSLANRIFQPWQELGDALGLLLLLHEEVRTALGLRLLLRLRHLAAAAVAALDTGSSLGTLSTRGGTGPRCEGSCIKRVHVTLRP